MACNNRHRFADAWQVRNLAQGFDAIHEIHACGVDDDRLAARDHQPVALLFLLELNLVFTVDLPNGSIMDGDVPLQDEALWGVVPNSRPLYQR